MNGNGDEKKRKRNLPQRPGERREDGKGQDFPERTFLPRMARIARIPGTKSTDYGPPGLKVGDTNWHELTRTSENSEKTIWLRMTENTDAREYRSTDGSGSTNNIKAGEP
jgi:hypothetical protein